ncbi:MotA/TolQ/ExbB proton channel family protein [Larsenimonas suaedae]|uniref:MotA/TolQ/ExbB proton channel family protein n=1 Tax=Larsenimonas suaedae TaxID=1851019 RepID=A0ABU1GV16_9GAMM|nr:MotA/TolQ/ExbB proton channel family protein [Larsenimonas suaedae]MCM2971137.1 MotA/TolQ/ExbB proton channel family protein [Larsenimonas suaedae]MDR5895846.1 MotA/TolQ/ExbB proton channel family protein [Larsenimonas suaedae]
MMRTAKALLLGTLTVLGASHALAAPTSLDEAVKQYTAEAQKAEARDQARLTELANDKSALQAELDKATDRLTQAKAKQSRLEARFDEQQQVLDDLGTQRGQQGGDVTAITSTLNAQLGKLDQSLDASWAHAFKGVTVPGPLDDDALPGADTLSNLNDQLASLLVATGQVSVDSEPVAGQDGTVAPASVARIGNVMAFTDQGLLRLPKAGQPLTLAPATPGDVKNAMARFIDSGGIVPLDVSDGEIVKALADQPSLTDRLAQGGVVGYITLGLGVLGLLVAIAQWAYLQRIYQKVRAQVKSLNTPSTDNPLGRVLARFKNVHPGSEPEALEARLDELLLAEQPVIERGQSLVKLIAAIAPLMGLLGTVTGMIGTFQSITVFGSSDPKLMAGGISQALITTVIGLIVAIPLLFAHTALSSRSRKLLNVLEGQASAHLAERLEGGEGKGHVPTA